MENIVLYGGLIESVASKKDKTIKIVIGANELKPDVMSDIMGMSGAFVYTAHKLEPFVTEEINAINKLKYEGKTLGKSMAEKMRDLFFVLWSKENCGFQQFDDYYVFQMNKYLDELRDRLSKLNI